MDRPNLKTTSKNESIGGNFVGEAQEKKRAAKTEEAEQKVREIGVFKTAGEFLDELTNMVDQHGRDLPIHISVPFRDGIGWHFENIKNITSHEGILDIHTTVPEYDDIKKKR